MPKEAFHLENGEWRVVAILCAHVAASSISAELGAGLINEPVIKGRSSWEGIAQHGNFTGFGPTQQSWEVPGPATFRDDPHLSEAAIALRRSPLIACRIRARGPGP